MTALPPSSVEAEQAVLGTLLLDNQAFDRIGFLKGEHFFRYAHRLVFQALKDLIEHGKPADNLLVTDYLEAHGDLDKTGGPVYLATLTQSAATSFNITRYAEVVRDKAILRDLQLAAYEIAEKAGMAGADPRELAEQAGSSFMGIELDESPSEMVEFGKAMLEAVEWADNPVKGLQTGYKALDDILVGMMPGDLIIIAGRPSMGKTALAMNIAEHVSKTVPAAVFSLEMTRRKIAGRSLKYHESILGRDGAVDHLSSLKLHIDDTPAISLGHMRLRLRRMKRKHGLSLVVVDYLQLMTAKAENRTNEVSALSRGLKAIAKEFEVPVIAVAQLNRTSEGRHDHRPILSDLRESGQIEQDADVIAFTYRDEYYHPDTPWKGIAEVLVRKNRDGATGTAHLTFVGEYTRFKPLDRPLPQFEPPKNKKVSNFDDYKSRAAGGE